MSANTYPTWPGDPILRTCRHCRSRVAAPSMCRTHPRTCMTCCSSRLKRRCGLEPNLFESVRDIITMTWEESQAELAQIRAFLGFRPETEAEKAENERWRTRHG